MRIGQAHWATAPSRARVLFLWREIIDYRQQPGDIAHRACASQHRRGYLSALRTQSFTF